MHTKLLVVLAVLITGTVSHAQSGSVLGARELEREIKREPVPASILADAVNAVQKLGDDTLRGKFAEVVDQLYPRYQKRAAKKLGGHLELEKQLRQAVADLAAGGITITGFSAEPALYGFDIPEFSEWLVFVPTTRIIRRIDTATGLVERGEIKDYQIAVRKKAEGSDWSFINGSTMSSREIRSLFNSLPADIENFAIPAKSYRKLP